MLVKQRRLTTPLFAIALLLVLSLQLPFQDSTRASELIADNFNDMDYDGWYTYRTLCNYTTTPGKSSLSGAGNFSAADKTLKVTGPSGNWTYAYWNDAYINSSISYGTWSFDLYVFNTTRGYSYVTLIADHYYPRQAWSAIPGPYMNNSYEIWIYTRPLAGPLDKPMITLERLYDGSGSIQGEYDVMPSTATWTNCWTHFDVTRNSTGYFNVYVNGTLRISVQDAVFPISGYFIFTGQSGWAIDNVAIFDYIVPPPPPPETTEPPLPPPDLATLMIVIVAIELIIIIVLLILYFRRRP